MVTLKNLKQNCKNYEAQRIIAQLDFIGCLSKFDKSVNCDLIKQAEQYLIDSYIKEGAVTKSAMESVEKILSPLSETAKRYEILCVAHAHLDMNWLWGYDETVSITLSTMQTMLDLMKEYKDFTFSQSQASVYKIVEDYAPEMLGDIKKWVREGRWEIAASSWVETDKNIPNGEELARHILYTKKYLSKLFDIQKESLNLDFEPDTFGHSVNVPEILANGGVKYYYHCRGSNGPEIYNWKAQSGKSVLVFREPFWYNSEIDYNDFELFPVFYDKYNIKKWLRVYGVGNHGGGATRRDLNRLIDMSGWPLMPKFKFSTYQEFFSYIENNCKNVEEIEGEQNFIFRGCYTSQTRIKTANRKGERLLNSTETLMAYADSLSLYDYNYENIEKAWQKHLFNHFHDILPGSGVIETREYALSESQIRNALCGVSLTGAIKSIADNIDTSKYITNNFFGKSKGAGVGFLTALGNYSAESNESENRIYVVFNPSSLGGEKIAQITLWDYDVQEDSIGVYDKDGNPLEFEVLDENAVFYWQHTYRRILVKIDLPAYGYNTVIIKENAAKNQYNYFDTLQDWRQHKPADYVLENKYIKAVFDDNINLVSILDKTKNKIYQDKCGLAWFSHIIEDGSEGMSSWITGRTKERHKLDKAKIHSVKQKKQGMVKSFEYDSQFGQSLFTVKVSLDDCSKSLCYDVKVDFREYGDLINYEIPSLAFTLKTEDKNFIHDVPFGLINREGENDYRPANSFVCSGNYNGGLILSSDSKNGFKCNDNEMTLSLIRATYDPDLHPENHIHNFKIHITPASFDSGKNVIDYVNNLYTPLQCISAKPQKGSLNLIDSFFSHEGCAVISCVKCSEDKSGIILRFYDADGKAGKNTVSFYKDIKEARLCDINENPLESCDIKGNKVYFDIKPYSVATVKVKLE